MFIYLLLFIYLSTLGISVHSKILHQISNDIPKFNQHPSNLMNDYFLQYPDVMPYVINYKSIESTRKAAEPSKESLQSKMKVMPEKKKKKKVESDTSTNSKLYTTLQQMRLGAEDFDFISEDFRNSITLNDLLIQSKPSYKSTNIFESKFFKKHSISISSFSPVSVYSSLYPKVYRFKVLGNYFNTCPQNETESANLTDEISGDLIDHILKILTRLNDLNLFLVKSFLNGRTNFTGEVKVESKLYNARYVKELKNYDRFIYENQLCGVRIARDLIFDLPLDEKFNAFSKLWLEALKN